MLSNSYKLTYNILVLSTVKTTSVIFKDYLK